MSYACLMEIVPDSRLQPSEAERKRKSWVYPWDEWTDGRTRVAKRGVDFTTTPEAFRNTLYAAGWRRRLSVVTRIYRDEVTFRFEPKAPITRQETNTE